MRITVIGNLECANTVTKQLLPETLLNTKKDAPGGGPALGESPDRGGVVPSGQELHILADSLLAIHTTTGAWKPRSNKKMVEANKAVLARLRKRGLEVRIRHVRAHRGHAMNERADALAKMGALGGSMRRAACPHPPTPPTPTPTPSPTPHQPLPAPAGASVNRETATVPD